MYKQHSSSGDRLLKEVVEELSLRRERVRENERERTIELVLERTIENGEDVDVRPNGLLNVLRLDGLSSLILEGAEGSVGVAGGRGGRSRPASMACLKVAFLLPSEINVTCNRKRQQDVCKCIQTAPASHATQIKLSTPTLCACDDVNRLERTSLSGNCESVGGSFGKLICPLSALSRFDGAHLHEKEEELAKAQFSSDNKSRRMSDAILLCRLLGLD